MNRKLKSKYQIESIETQCLIDLDEQLAKLILMIDEVTCEIDVNGFRSISKSIVGQQISEKAKNTIWRRLDKACDMSSPEAVLKTDDYELREVGISWRKIKYIKNLSENVVNGNINFKNFETLSNGQIIKQLSSHYGIGVWTVEMFLIFSMRRVDVASVTDIGLRRAAQWLYSIDHQPNKKEMAEILSKWEPYQSIASLYLWAAIERGLIKTQL